MDNTLFLAQLFGIYFLVMGVVIIVRNKEMSRVINSFINNEALGFVIGIFTLLIGLLIVLSHNVWEAGLAWIVTLIGWLTLLKGVAYLLLSPKSFAGVAKMIVGSKSYIWVSVVTIIIGAYLAAKGFGLY